MMGCWTPTTLGEISYFSKPLLLMMIDVSFSTDEFFSVGVAVDISQRNLNNIQMNHEWGGRPFEEKSRALNEKCGGCCWGDRSPHISL
jgi:hypothetical protein